MSKPTLEDTRWAVTAGGSEASNQADPIIKDDGYSTTGIPSSANFNWLLRKIHSWFQFLDPMFSSGGSLTLPASQTLTVPGNTTLGAALAVTGTATANALVATTSVTATSGVVTNTLTANVLVGTTSLSAGTATITNTATANALVATTSILAASAGITNTATANALVATTSVTCDSANVNGATGLTFGAAADEHFSTDRFFVIDGSAFRPDSGGTWTRAQFDGVNYINTHTFFDAGGTNGSGDLSAAMQGIRDGDRITTIQVCLARTNNPDGQEVLIIEDNSTTATTENVVFTSSALTRPSANAISSTVVAPNYTYNTGNGLRLRLSTTSTATGGVMAVRWVVVRYDRP